MGGRAVSALGRLRCVGGGAVKTKLAAEVREIARLLGRIAIRGMPMQGRIDVLEKPGTHEVHLAGATLLGGCAKHANLASGASGLEPLLHGDRGCDDQVGSKPHVEQELLGRKRIGE